MQKKIVAYGKIPGNQKFQSLFIRLKDEFNSKEEYVSFKDLPNSVLLFLMFEKLGNKQREVNRKVSGDPTVFGLTYSMQSTVEEAYTPGSFGLVDTFNTFNMKGIWIEPSQCTYYSDNCTALGQRKQNGKKYANSSTIRVDI